MYKPGPISAKPLSVLLSDVFSDAYAKQGFAARELVTRWAEIAGPEIAAHSEPLKIQWPRPVEGQPQEPATLVLRVDGPMALEIQHSSDVILQRVNRFFGWSAVGRLALRQAPLSRRDKPKAPQAPDAAEVAVANAIAEGIGGGAASTGGKLSWPQLAGLIGHAKIFAGVDTAAMHLAAACQTPTIGVFGPSIDWQWSPWKCPHRVCAPPAPPAGLEAKRRMQLAEQRDIREVATASVVRACEELLS